MSDTLPIRVMVPDVWDEVALTVPATTTAADLKHRALTASHVTRDPAGYVLKYRGAAITDETRSLAELGVVPNAHVIVLARKRRAVR